MERGGGVHSGQKNDKKPNFEATTLSTPSLPLPGGSSSWEEFNGFGTSYNWFSTVALLVRMNTGGQLDFRIASSPYRRNHFFFTVLPSPIVDNSSERNNGPKMFYKRVLSQRNNGTAI